jgi:uncharacterized protein YbjT (DUF2867 family)
MIALTTPTGTIGSKVLRILTESNHQPIRVLARNPAKIPDGIRTKIQIIEGSMGDASALRRLCDEAEALFWCQPDATFAEDYYDAYEKLAGGGAAAIREAGVARVVAISATGEPSQKPAGPITALHRMESILAETGVSARFLRCGSFFENLLWQWDQIIMEGIFTYPASGDVPGPQVATADIARVATEWLTNPKWVGQETVPLLGPKDLSYDEIASCLSHALGKEVRYHAAFPADYLVAMRSIGQSESAAQGLVDMFAYLTQYYEPPKHIDRSQTLTTLAEWMAR